MSRESGEDDMRIPEACDVEDSRGQVLSSRAETCEGSVAREMRNLWSQNWVTVFILVMLRGKKHGRVAVTISHMSKGDPERHWKNLGQSF